MDLRQLRTFIMVAETGSLSKASDRLRLVQPALSRQIRLLEAEIGVDLFTRSGRGMHITEHGSELLSRVRSLVSQLENSIDDVRSLSSRPAGQVVLGIIPSVSYVLAGRVAVQVAHKLPDVSLRIIEAYAGHLIDWLHRGDVDLALIYGPAADLHMRVKDVLFEELVLVSPSSFEMPERDIHVSELGRMKLVLPSKPHGLRMVVEAAAEKALTTLQVKYEADSFRVLKELVQAGLGHTVLPLSAFHREQHASTFKISRLIKPRISRQIVLALPSSRIDKRAASAVGTLILEEIRELVASGEWQIYPNASILPPSPPTERRENS